MILEGEKTKTAAAGKTAVILIGIPASGKTTFCKQNLINRDFCYFHREECFSPVTETQTFRSCLESGKSFVVDNVNATRGERTAYIGPARERGYHIVGCYFRSSVSDCIRRSREKEDRVPEKSIVRDFNRMEAPDRGEGYDELWYITIGDRGNFLMREWREDTVR